MRESDAPPPGDPANRRGRVWAFLIMAVILLFLVWFAAENWDIRRPGRDTSGPGPNSTASE
jgi:hypothetical protein